MPQMSNLWWLSLIIYFLITFILMNMTIFSCLQQLKTGPISTPLKKKFNNWKW